jgi:hypothetical protein
MIIVTDVVIRPPKNDNPAHVNGSFVVKKKDAKNPIAARMSGDPARSMNT